MKPHIETEYLLMEKPDSLLKSKTLNKDKLYIYNLSSSLSFTYELWDTGMLHYLFVNKFIHLYM